MLRLALRIAIQYQGVGERISLCLLEGSQSWPACPSGKNSMKIEMKICQAEGIGILAVVA